MGSRDSMVVMESERASSRGQDPKDTEESGRFGKKISSGVAKDYLAKRRYLYGKIWEITKIF